MKYLFKFLKFVFSTHFSLIASLASIVGLIIVFIQNRLSVYVALIAFILFLLIILIRLFFVFKTFLLQKTENGYHKFAIYVRYSTEDGSHISYELHKYIQCKSVIMNEHEHSFHWTGSKDPVISSHLQDYLRFIRTHEGEYDKAIFRFKRPLTYNDFCIVHIKMDLDDSDGKSKHFCDQSILEPVQLVSFRIELKHLDDAKDAKIMRRRLNTKLIQDYDTIGYIKFDPKSQSYEHNIFNPETGYSYMVNWE